MASEMQHCCVVFLSFVSLDQKSRRYLYAVHICVLSLTLLCLIRLPTLCVCLTKKKHFVIINPNAPCFAKLHQYTVMTFKYKHVASMSTVFNFRDGKVSLELDT